MKTGVEKSNIMYDTQKRTALSSPWVVDPGLEPESPP